MSIRKILNISGVITNSSTETFIIEGPNALKAMIGVGLWRKYRKNFVYLQSEEDVENFVRYGKGFDHHYYRGMVSPLLPRGFWNLYEQMSFTFQDREEEVWNFFGPEFLKRLKGAILYYDYRNNQKIMNVLENKFPKYAERKDGIPKYEWFLD